MQSVLNWHTQISVEKSPISCQYLTIRPSTPISKTCSMPRSREKSLLQAATRKIFLRRIHPTNPSGRITGVAVTFSDVTDRTIIELKLRQREIWLNAQMSAFELAMTNAPIEHSLGLLISALVDGTEDDRRCAFYIAQGDGLRHVVGMPDEYAKCVNGFLIAEESLACGLAVATGKPVITRDIMIEPRWKPWIWLAKRFGYRGCWSFPVMETRGTHSARSPCTLRSPRADADRPRTRVVIHEDCGNHHCQTSANKTSMT